MRSHEPSREIAHPRAGFYRLRLVRGGWRVPARIVHGEDGLWMAVIDGVPSLPVLDPAECPAIEKIWTGGSVITETEFRYLEALREACKRWQPSHPAANPTRPINPMSLSPVEPK